MFFCRSWARSKKIEKIFNGTRFICLRRQSKNCKYFVNHIFKILKLIYYYYSIQAVWSIVCLLNRAKTFVKREYWDKTIIQLRATAGLRQLEEKKSKRILDEVYTILFNRFVAHNINYHFLIIIYLCFKINFIFQLKELFNKSDFVTDDNSVDIMGGDDEGVFSWFTVNILNSKIPLSKQYRIGKNKLHNFHIFLDSLVGDLNNTSVVIDLGGGSVQISYIPKGVHNTENCIYKYEMMGTDICLYSKRYLLLRSNQHIFFNSLS